MKQKSTSPLKRKAEVNLALEKLEAIGQESEKEGIKYTQQFMKEWDQKQEGRGREKKGQLERMKRFSKPEYYRLVAGMIQEELSDLDIPVGYRTWAEMSGDGVIAKMTDLKGKTYYKAFKPDGSPEVDFKAVVGILTDIQNSIDYLEYERAENLKKLGLILPPH